MVTVKQFCILVVGGAALIAVMMTYGRKEAPKPLQTDLENGVEPGQLQVEKHHNTHDHGGHQHKEDEKPKEDKPAKPAPADDHGHDHDHGGEDAEAQKKAVEAAERNAKDAEEKNKKAFEEATKKKQDEKREEEEAARLAKDAMERANREKMEKDAEAKRKATEQQAEEQEKAKKALADAEAERKKQTPPANPFEKPARPDTTSKFPFEKPARPDPRLDRDPRNARERIEADLRKEGLTEDELRRRLIDEARLPREGARPGEKPALVANFDPGFKAGDTTDIRGELQEIDDGQFRYIDPRGLGHHAEGDENCYIPEGDILLEPTQCSPHWFVIGALKCGTTSLYTYLSRHPNSTTKVDQGNPLKIKEPGYWKQSKLPPLKKYMRIFPMIKAGDQKVTGEGSPDYIFGPMTPHNLLSTFPDSKFVLLIREPVERAYSRVNHWITVKEQVTQEEVGVMFEELMREQLEQTKYCLKRWSGIGGGRQNERQSWKGETPSQARERASRAPDNRICEPSSNETIHDYIDLVQCWRALARGSPVSRNSMVKPTLQPTARSLRPLLVIPHGMDVLSLINWYYVLGGRQDQLLVVRSEDFYGDTKAAMEEITEHLNLPFHDWSEVVGKKYNVGKPRGTKGNQMNGGVGFNVEAPELKPHEFSDEIRGMLEDFYEPFNKALEELTGRKFWDYSANRAERTREAEGEDEASMDEDAEEDSEVAPAKDGDKPAAAKAGAKGEAAEGEAEAPKSVEDRYQEDEDN